eukprot:scaffold53150_cov34-Phaeocystis_antarctica.AAC.1
MVSWSQAASGPKQRACDAFSAALATHGVTLGGEAFLLGLGAPCNPNPNPDPDPLTLPSPSP